MYTTYSPNDILASSGQEMSGKEKPSHVENDFDAPYENLDSFSDRRERPSNGCPNHTASHSTDYFYTGVSYHEETSNHGRNSDHGKSNHGGINDLHSERLPSRDAASNHATRPSIRPERNRENERRRVLPSTYGHMFSSQMNPSSLFTPEIIRSGLVRYTNFYNSTSRLVFVDGACTNNGQPGAKAGWGVIVEPVTKNDSENKSGRLESRSKSGRWYPQTSNRAELRAVLAAMTEWDWKGEGCKVLVIATDSAYVYSGLTVSIRQWLKHNWTNSRRQPVKNRDFWEELLDAVEKLVYEDVEVLLWKIKREYNEAADALAKEAAQMEPINR